MFKIFLKYCIYDFCINLIFKKIKNNFITLKLSRLPKPGEFISKVSHKEDDENYYNCIIKRIEIRKNEMGKKYYVIDLTYSFCDGKIFGENWPPDQSNANWEVLEDEYETSDDDDDELEEIQECYNKGEYKTLLDHLKADAVENEHILSVVYNCYNFFK